MDEPYQEFSIKFILYDYFGLQFNYEKGHFGSCICNGDVSIPISTVIEWDDNCDYDNYWREVDDKIRIRIPDKFLKAHGWL